MTERDKEKIRLACTRWIAWEPLARRRPKNHLSEIAAMATEDLDYDRYGEGPVINSFEAEVATLLGKPAAVFMPSGTMAQQIALRIWSDRKRIRTVAFHPKCHLECHEEKAYERLHGLSVRLTGDPDRLMTPADVRKIAEPISTLLIELPQREIGGQLPSFDELREIRVWAEEKGVALHLDGARLWESAAFYDRSYANICALFDSVYVSTYKGLGGISGCVLAGPADFIAEARIWQRRHGGNLICMYPFVLAAKAGLDERLPKMRSYVEKAKRVAAKLSAVEGIEIVPNPPHTNMMHIFLEGDRERLQEAALDIAEETGVWTFMNLAATPIPSRQRFELSCGDATLELEDELIASLFQRIIERAKKPL